MSPETLAEATACAASPSASTVVGPSALACTQAYDSHPYATYCFFIEEMNKRGIAYVHMVEPRAKGKEGAASPVAEFSNEHTDETLEASLCLLTLLICAVVRS